MPGPFLAPADGVVRELVPGVTARVFWADRMTVTLTDLAPDAEIPGHHHSAEQAGVVVSGTLDLRIGEELRRLNPGDAYLIPGGVEHSARAVGGAVQVFEAFHPQREELHRPG